MLLYQFLFHHFKLIDAYAPEENLVKLFLNYPDDYRPTTVDYRLAIQTFCNDEKITCEFYSNGITLQLPKLDLPRHLGKLNEIISACRRAENAAIGCTP